MNTDQNRKAPEFYLDQTFTFTSGNTTFNVRVQLYNTERKAFLLYDPDGCTSSFYRDETFVYEHCQPAETPVVRQSFPVMEIDKRRFLNLLSITDPLHPLNKYLKAEDEIRKPQTALQRMQAIYDTLKRDNVLQKMVHCVYPSQWRTSVYIEVRECHYEHIKAVVDQIMDGHTDVEIKYKRIGVKA